VIRPIAVASTL